MDTRIIKLVVVAVILLVFLGWINVADALGHLMGISLALFLLGCIANAGVQFMRAVRFDVITRTFGVRPPFRRSVFAHFISSLIGMVTPARLGEGGKVFLFKKDRKELGFCFILEKIFDFAMLIMVSIIGIFALGQQVQLPEWFFYLILVGITIGAILLLKINKVLNYVFKTDIGDKWFRGMLGKALSDKKIVIFAFLTLVVWGTLFLAAYIFMLAIGVQAGFVTFSFITAISMMVGLASGLPGGLGLSEFSYTILLSAVLGIGISLAGAVAITIMLGAYITHTAIALVSSPLIKRSP